MKLRKFAVLPLTMCLLWGCDDSVEDLLGGSNGDGEVAGVEGSKNVGELTESEATALCEHFDGLLVIDEDRGCCVGTALYSAMVPDADSCEDILADCLADPAAFECGDDEEDHEGEDHEDEDDCTNDPIPECTGDVTVDEVATCIEAMVTGYTAILDDLDCDSDPEELESLGENGPPMPDSCDVVLEHCPDIFDDED